MPRKTEPDAILCGRVSHRRTQADYLQTLLDRVTLDTWGEVIDATVARAKEGDAQARSWLAGYLVGRPATEAPAPLDVVAARLSGDDPLVAKLAAPTINEMENTYRADHFDTQRVVRTQVAAELATRIDTAAEPAHDATPAGHRLRAVGGPP